jgi:ADP-ribosylglycohydrolase
MTTAHTHKTKKKVKAAMATPPAPFFFVEGATLHVTIQGRTMREESEKGVNKIKKKNKEDVYQRQHIL